VHLTFFQPPLCGHLSSAWRHPWSDPARPHDLEALVHDALLAESACFDAVFHADSHALNAKSGRQEFYAFPDPLIALGALASRTSKIGLVATISTIFSQPFDVARRVATLQKFSGGRVGVNVVTSHAEAAARNYGDAQPVDPETRYERAAEFCDLALELWSSWDDPLRLDKANGIYADVGRIRPVEHEGRYFRCSGMLPVDPGEQPVLVQSGQSDSGREFAAGYADLIFTGQNDMMEARAFARDIRTRAERYGRSGGDIRILPGVIPVLGHTEAEARELEVELRNLMDGESGLREIDRILGVDLSMCDLDDPVPAPEVITELARTQGRTNTIGSRTRIIFESAHRDKATIRELMFIVGARGHLTVVGTPKQLADVMQTWVEAGACDGFTIAPALIPATLELFVEEVVPILRARGLFRSSYSGSTLRDHLGLAVPGRRRIDEEVTA
jgi:FMN-dependent oxidoreductase (nitrilotriacetate monooxygenase family)